MTCGGVRCAYYVAENGRYGLVDAVVPAFTGYSLTDEWRPRDRIAVNAGVRVDKYSFTGTDTNTGAARGLLVRFLQPRHVLRQTNAGDSSTAAAFGGSWSTNSQKPCSAFGSAVRERQDANAPAQYHVYHRAAAHRCDLHRQSRHRVCVPARENTTSSRVRHTNSTIASNRTCRIRYRVLLRSVSIRRGTKSRRRFRSTATFRSNTISTEPIISMKLTPFLRQTQNEVENFYINYTSGITSGLNAGNQTSKGFEFELNKGDFARNGLSGQLSFAYTYATVKYGLLPNGTTILDPINAGIAQYNAYTKACTPGGSQYGKREFGRARLRLDQRRFASRTVLYARRCAGSNLPPSERRRQSVLAVAGFYVVRSFGIVHSVLDLSRSGRLRRQRIQLSVRRDAHPELQAQPVFDDAVVAVSGWKPVRCAAHDPRNRSGIGLRSAYGFDRRRSALPVRS